MSLESLQDGAQQAAHRVHQKGGFELYIKTHASSISRLLVEKGIVTEEEILTAFIKECNTVLQKKVI